MTPFWLAASALLSFAVGLLVVLLLWPGAPARHLAVKIFLAAGLGQGVTSCVAFLYLLANGRLDRFYYTSELFALAALLAGLLFKLRRRREPAAPPVEGKVGQAGRGWLAVAFYAAAAAALGAVLIDVWRMPYGGGWDAWAIYNLRARAIFRGGAEWREGFSALIGWSHPDYPLLLPLSVARAWMYAGRETTAAPAMLGWLFTAATVGLLSSSVAALRGRSQGYLAGLVLLGFTFFIAHGSSQYADVPLMFFYTAAVVLFALAGEAGSEGGRGGWLVLAGLAAGMAAWAKNEGALFIVAAGAAHLAVAAREGGLKRYFGELRFVLTGLLPVLICVFYFKARIAPPSELVEAMAGQTALRKLADPSRHLLIAREFARRFLYYSGRGVNLAYVLLIYLSCLGLGREGPRRGAAFGAITLALMLGGYYFVYLTTPYELAWHVKFSLDRVLLQLWPSLVFVFFLVAATPEETIAR